MYDPVMALTMRERAFRADHRRDEFVLERDHRYTGADGVFRGQIHEPH
jgi:hypothetical protein